MLGTVDRPWGVHRCNPDTRLSLQGGIVPAHVVLHSVRIVGFPYMTTLGDRTVGTGSTSSS